MASLMALQPWLMVAQSCSKWFAGHDGGAVWAAPNPQFSGRLLLAAHVLDVFDDAVMPAWVGDMR